MSMFKTNELIKVNSPSKISQSINVERRTCHRNCSNAFSESNKNFGRLVGKNIFPLDFIKCLNYSEVQSLF